MDTDTPDQRSTEIAYRTHMYFQQHIDGDQSGRPSEETLSGLLAGLRDLAEEYGIDFNAALPTRSTPPTSYPVTAQVQLGDYAEPFAQVVVGPATIVAHSSTVDLDTVNLEVDGEFAGTPDRLRIHVNDQAVYDSTLPRSQHFEADQIEALIGAAVTLYLEAGRGVIDDLSERQVELLDRANDLHL